MHSDAGLPQLLDDKLIVGYEVGEAVHGQKRDWRHVVFTVGG